MSVMPHPAMTEAERSKQVEFKLELDRTNLLYLQNIQGIIGLTMYGASFLYYAWDIIPKYFLYSWGGILFFSALIRIVITIIWQKKKVHLTETRQIVRWLRAVQVLLLISGLCWGTIAVFVPYLSGPAQLITCMAVVLMAAGAVAAYSSSLLAMYAVFAPSLLMWSVSLWLAGDSTYRLMSLMVFAYFLMGIRVSSRLQSYVTESLRLNVVNSVLTANLENQIQIKDKAQRELQASQARLNLALDASGAVTWIWNPKTDEFNCDGNLRALIGIDTHSWNTTFEDFVKIAHKEDQQGLKAVMRSAAERGAEFEFEYRVPRPDGIHIYVAQRGRTVHDASGEILNVTGISWDITDKKAQEELRREINEHEAANRAKSVLLANASHEIRTPLAAINGFTDVLLQNQTLPPEVRQDLQMILRNGKYLVSLVSDLLDLSKIESGEIYIQKNRISAIKEINDVAALMQPLAHSRGLELAVRYINPVPEFIETDETRFREVLLNLLTNSTKFTEKGSVVLTVRFELLEGHTGLLHICVNDTGIGISAENQRRLFRPFTRGESEQVQKVQGSGLGLALSRNLAHLLGGDLKLLRSELNKGCEFEFTLTTGPINDTRLVSPEEAASLHLEATQPAKGLPLLNRSILVVDDSPDLQALMTRFLAMRGAKVETRSNGLEAVERLKEKTYDIVLMDVKMPVMDGHTAASLVRKNNYTGPIVAITAHASAEDRQLCYQAGYDSYVAKPVDFKVLIPELLKLMEMRNTRTGPVPKTEAPLT